MDRRIENTKATGICETPSDCVSKMTHKRSTPIQSILYGLDLNNGPIRESRLSIVRESTAGQPLPRLGVR